MTQSDDPDLDAAYGLKTPEDSVRLYGKWAATYDLDPQRMHVGGHSAGGHLAQLLNLRWSAFCPSCPPAVGAIGFEGIYDIAAWDAYDASFWGGAFTCATRKAFGATLWDKQAIRQRLSMLAARVAAARQFVYATAARDAAGEEVTREVSMIKALCGELVNDVMYDCLQFHGGFGYMRESAIERMTRDARVQAIGGGATEVMLEEVAKRL